MATTIDPLDFQAMAAIHAKGWNLTSKIVSGAPDPQEFLHMYSPMKFKKLHNKPFHINRLKNWGHSKEENVFDVTSMRHALMLGVKRLAVQFPKGTRFHELIREHGGGRLTSDLPIEIYSQYIEFSKVYGDVLVGGLGLGMSAEMILHMPNVTSVTVIEKEPKIIELIKPQIDPRIEVREVDLFEYLKTYKPTARIPDGYDSAYFDIWYGTGESYWKSYVAPLYLLARRAGIKTLSAWGEWEMKWQLVGSLYTRAKVPEKFSNWKPYRIFLDGLKKKLGGEPPYGDEHDPEIERLIGLYLNEIGSAEWEATFPGDEFLKEKDEDS